MLQDSRNTTNKILVYYSGLPVNITSKGFKKLIKEAGTRGRVVYSRDFNISSIDQALDNCDTVVFRRRYFDKLPEGLTSMGHLK